MISQYKHPFPDIEISVGLFGQNATIGNCTDDDISESFYHSQPQDLMDFLNARNEELDRENIVCKFFEEETMRITEINQLDDEPFEIQTTIPELTQVEEINDFPVEDTSLIYLSEFNGNLINKACLTRCFLYIFRYQYFCC